MDGFEEIVSYANYIHYIPILSKEYVEERVKNFKDYCSLENVKVRTKSINKSIIESRHKQSEAFNEYKTKITPYYLSGRNFDHLDYLYEATIESLVMSSTLELRKIRFY